MILSIISNRLLPMPTSTPKYHLLALGCQMNVSDGERAAKVLEDIGYTKAASETEADLMMVIACSVRQSAVDRVHGKIATWEKLKKKKTLVTILSGCVLPHDKERLGKRFDLVLDIKNLLNLPAELVKLKDSKLPPEQIGLHQEKYADNYFAVRPKYSNGFQAYVPIMTGCNAFCTYCAVPYTRGRELSRQPQDILTEVAQLVKHGYKEITLLGQIINKYMIQVDDKFMAWLEEFKKDNNIPDLPELHSEYFTEKKLFKFPQLLALCASLPGDYWLRYTSSHPKWFTDELIETLAKYHKLHHHAHLPVQAGHDVILKRMLRPYTIEEYKKIVHKLRIKIPDLAVTTDCIVGFPGETREQFESTLDLFREMKYDMAFTAQFSPRPGSVAGKWEDDVPHAEKEFREKELTDVLRQTTFDHNQALLNTKQRVLIYKTSKKNTGFEAEGRTGGMKPIRFTTPTDMTGQFVNVKVTKAEPWHLKGNLVNPHTYL